MCSKPNRTAYAPRITHHTPRITHHTSRITHHTPRITHHTSRITHHSPHTTHHASHTTHHAARSTYHTNNVLRWPIRLRPLVSRVFFVSLFLLPPAPPLVLLSCLLLLLLLFLFFVAVVSCFLFSCSFARCVLFSFEHLSSLFSFLICCFLLGCCFFVCSCRIFRFVDLFLDTLCLHFPSSGLFCIVRVSFFTNLLFSTSLLLAALAAAFAVSLYRPSLKPQCMKGTVYLMLFAYPLVAVKVVQAFGCHDVDGNSYLRADYRVQCYTQEWTMMVAYASVFSRCTCFKEKYSLRKK